MSSTLAAAQLLAATLSTIRAEDTAYQRTPSWFRTPEQRGRQERTKAERLKKKETRAKKNKQQRDSRRRNR